MVHMIAPVEHEPRKVLTRWRLMKVRRKSGEFTRHLVGRVHLGERAYEGRSSTSIQQIDPIAMTLRTKSGRIYQLDGPSGFDDDAQHVFHIWLQLNGSTAVKNESHALVRLNRMRSRLAGVDLLDPDCEPTVHQWSALLKEVGEDVRERHRLTREKHGPALDAAVQRARAEAQRLIDENEKK